MAEAVVAPAPGGEQAQADIEGGNYEVIRRRLVEQGRELKKRTDALNKRRREVFGGTELKVVANERIRTEHNCVPRDIVQIGGYLLLGYNVFIGLKSETKVGDVFSIHNFKKKEDGAFDCSDAGLGTLGGFLSGDQFLKDFTALYKYTKDAQLLSLRRSDTQLLAVFQIGATYQDIKVLRWSINAAGKVTYVDDRGDRDWVFPRPHEFEWQTPDINDQIDGRYINVRNKVFVSNLHSTLRLAVEDNTPAGRRVFSEPVDDGNQGISDLGLWFAEVGPLVVLKVLPFREKTHRYIVFNAKTEHAVRIDAIGLACQELPEDHGIIFPGGYYLESGEHKVFEAEDTEGLEFKRKIVSPNGEDSMYVYHRRSDGHYVLFPYNLIRKEVQTPIHCHGFSLFDDGVLVVFRAMTNEPTRVHPMQVWQTPFMSAELAAAAPTDGSFLANVGNAELVRGISDAFSICRLIDNAEPTRHIFEDLIRNTSRTIDSYFWLDNQEVGNLKSTLNEIATTADLIVDEFEKVVSFREDAKKALAATEDKFAEATRDMRTEHFKRVDPFLEALTTLRGLRGHIITLREMRYMDLGKLQALEDKTVERFDEVSRDCVAFLLKEEALAPLISDLEATVGMLGSVEKVADVLPLKRKVDVTAEGLDLLSEVVANLQIEDATQRTKILEGISEVFGQLNRTRATIEGRRKELLVFEGKAEFAAQFAVLGQSVSSALAVCDTPEKCDEQLSRLMVQLEELESRFSEFDEYLGELTQKREEIFDAFNAKKQQLVDERQRRIANIGSAADRILEGVARRGRAMKDADELNAYFASDAMVMKVRQLCDQLAELGDSVKADGYLAKLKTARQDALRGLRDKLELFTEGDNLIKLGKHLFSVNTQKLEMSMVPRDGAMTLHMSGTDYHAPVEDERFAATQRFWSQTLVSENDDVYRGEYLAFCILEDAVAGVGGLSVSKLHEHLRENTLVELARRYTQDRYDEGYDRGLHDADTALILEKLIHVREAAGLLRFPPAPRALGAMFWDHSPPSDDKKRWHLQAKSLGRLRKSLGHSDAVATLARELAEAVGAFVNEHRLGAFFTASEVALAGDYLFEELVDAEPKFATSAEAKALQDDLLRHIDLHGDRRSFDDDMRALEGDLEERFRLAKAWVDAFLAADPERRGKTYLAPETAAMLCDKQLHREPSGAIADVEVTGLLGQHRRIEGQKLKLRIDEFLARLGHFAEIEVPAYREYRKLRHEILENERHRLRIDEFMPKVMTSFVRNRLINEVYLPLIGDNLAKQMGAAGDAKRTDLMGLLLLVSPPGYGKTTIMEYIANRLGLVFMKINGPALGHSVVSLDPGEAPNATARQEVEKINLAFEMGNNVMLYLDDIQHTHPELLQKFISLCDAQRRIEGVWRGRTRTYDMRGKKFCVVMAGNPYTESGDKFTIPDMLANRADTYNLGDILEGKDDVFALSYIENALTSNPTLQPLATREQADVYKLIGMARGEEIPTSDLKHGYSAVELTEIKTVLAHMFRAQETILRVNQMYIESASQDDRFRTEPPFKLQGSYRNMNRLAEKIVSAMNEGEVEALIVDHYLGESQTLTTGAEANLLKLAEIRNNMTEAQLERWTAIKEEYVRHKRMGGSADDPVSRVTGTLSGLSEDLTGIKKALEGGGGAKATEKAIRSLAGQLGFIRIAIENAMEEMKKEAPKGKRKTDVPPPEAPAASPTAAVAPTQLAPPGGALGAGAVNAQVDKLAAQLDAIRESLAFVAQTYANTTARKAQEAFTEHELEVQALLKQHLNLVEHAVIPLAQTAARSQTTDQHVMHTLGEVRQLLHHFSQRHG